MSKKIKEEELVILTYNVLATKLCKKDQFLHIKPEYLENNIRLPKIIDRIKNINADIVCLQEFEWSKLGQEVLNLGYVKYSCQYYSNSNTFGNAIFVRDDRFKVIAHKYHRYTDSMQNFIALEIESILTQRRYIIFNTHLKSRYNCGDVRENQIGELCKFINELNYGDLNSLSDNMDTTNRNKEYAKRKIILCGDFNDMPESNVIKKLLLNSEQNFVCLNIDEQNNNDKSREINKSHKIQEANYTLVVGHENEAIKNMFVDYIFTNVKCNFENITKKLDKIIPSKDEPSDHFPQIVKIRI